MGSERVAFILKNPENQQNIKRWWENSKSKGIKLVRGYEDTYL